MKKTKPLTSLCFAALATITLSSLNAVADSDTVYRYNYTDGTLANTYVYDGGFTTPTGTNAPSDMAGATFGDLIASGRAWGTGHSSLVLAFDWAEDNQVNYLTEGGVATWYFSSNANTNAQSGTPGRTQFFGGTFDGQDILGNPNVIAVYDDQVVLYNPSAASDATSLTLYSLNTGVVTLADFGFETFSGTGPLSGLTLSSQLGNLIGAEDGYLWFLDPDGSFSAYGITSGATVLDPTWTTFSGGMMDGVSIFDAVTGGHYLGIGAGPHFYFTESLLIPEPSSVVLLGAMGLGILLAGRRTFKREAR